MSPWDFRDDHLFQVLSVLRPSCENAALHTHVRPRRCGAETRGSVGSQGREPGRLGWGAEVIAGRQWTPMRATAGELVESEPGGLRPGARLVDGRRGRLPRDKAPVPCAASVYPAFQPRLACVHTAHPFSAARAGERRSELAPLWFALGTWTPGRPSGAHKTPSAPCRPAG